MNGIIFALIASAFAIWALIAVANSKLSTNKKILWFALIILVPFIGPIAYWFRYKY
ncbi:Phospholipase_D-nuclease N-terminal [Reichenbachiella faecimaris]|uniref:Phospholipase_D-nuclease N-terminal n=1 Tax=Reichenbachiella faecimaris TaxID=692418 RepID=A0A1W2G5U3_REIFA|nr:PLD nuclease N-terminal domain-containing protein [Reichenbachiella faecimaris]SMD31961.1 Phospholipase_D-nuclease N-terminal [Reichenbachiella faecimaris]